MLRESFWNWVPWIYNKYTSSIDKCLSLYNAVYRELFSKKGLILLKNHHIPLSQESCASELIPKADIRWIATLDPPRIQDPRITKPEFKHIPYLGFIATADTPFSSEPIDLSDWINSLLWSGLREPTPLDIFALWCSKTKSHLIYFPSFITIELVTEDGEIIKRGLNDYLLTNNYEDGTTCESN